MNELKCCDSKSKNRKKKTESVVYILYSLHSDLHEKKDDQNSSSTRYSPLSSAIRLKLSLYVYIYI